MDPATALLISAGTSLVNTAGNIGMQGATNSQNLQLWKQQQEYNKPVNQIARLREAGLNPALMYGTGSTVATGNIGDPPNMQAPKMAIDSPLGDLLKYQTVHNLDLQSDNLAKQNEILTANATVAQNEATKSNREIGILKDKDSIIPPVLLDKAGFGGILTPVLSILGSSMGGVSSSGSNILQKVVH